MQMQGYVQVFGRVLRLGLPEVSHQAGLQFATSLPLAAAATFQRAVATEMRMQQQGAGALEENVAESSIQDILDLQCRNRAKDEQACLSVPLADAVKGPGHVAWKLIQDINGDTSNDFVFNDDRFLSAWCNESTALALSRLSSKEEFLAAHAAGDSLFPFLSSVKFVRKPGDAQQLAGAGSASQLHLVDGTDQSVELAPAKSTFELLPLARACSNHSCGIRPACLRNIRQSA